MTDIIFDAVELVFDASKRTSQGYLKVDGFNSRAGVLDYGGRKELRAPREIKKYIHTMDALPVTAGHPMHEGQQVLLDQSNTHIYQAGYYAGSPQFVDNRIKVTRVITDAKLDAEITSGARRELSLGGTRLFVPGPHPDYPDGTYNDEAYDGWQDNITWNHEAVVTRGRAGGGCSLMMDGLEAMFDSSEEILKEKINLKEEPRMANIVFDSHSLEVTDVAKLALEHKFQADAAKLAGAQAQIDAAKAKADGLQAMYDEAQAQLLELKKVTPQDQTKKLRDLERKAEKVLGQSFVFDGLDEDAIKVAVIKKQRPNLDLTGKSPTYLEVAFDAIMEALPANPLLNPGGMGGYSPQYQQAMQSWQQPAAPGVIADGLDKAIAGQANSYEARYKGAKN